MFQITMANFETEGSEPFWLVLAINITSTPKLVQAHDSAVSLTIF